MHKYSLVILGLLMLTACGGTGGPEPEPESNSLRVNEVVSSNDGVSIDETGQTSDWIELTNTTKALTTSVISGGTPII